MENDNTQHDVTSLPSAKRSEVFVYVYKKTEQVITALYLITNLLQDSEPLKWQIRHKAVGLLGELLPLKDSKTSDRVRLRLLPAISEMLSLMDIGERAELVSSMNAGLVRRELTHVGEVLKERYGGGYLAEDFFKQLEGARTTDHLTLLKDTHEKTEQEAEMLKGHEALKDTLEYSKRTSVNRKKTTLPSSSNTDDGERRKERILAVLKKQNGEISIRDISHEVSGCSEKTIQRDLGALIQEGRVRQHGARRWTRYSLVR